MLQRHTPLGFHERAKDMMLCECLSLCSYIEAAINLVARSSTYCHRRPAMRCFVRDRRCSAADDHHARKVLGAHRRRAVESFLPCGTIDVIPSTVSILYACWRPQRTAVEELHLVNQR